MSLVITIIPTYDNLAAESNYTIIVTGCNNNRCSFDSVNISTANIVPGSKLLYISISLKTVKR